MKEEMGLSVLEVASLPSYYLIGKNQSDKWSLNLVFETKVKDLNFTSTDECREVRFISSEEVGSINAFRNVKELAALFKTRKSNLG
jgi:hypothetical protein